MSTARIKLCGPFYVQQRVAVLVVAVSTVLLLAMLWSRRSPSSFPSDRVASVVLPDRVVSRDSMVDPAGLAKAALKDKQVEESPASLNLSEKHRAALWSKFQLKPLKSRGATIFIDEKENIRIPPDFILDMMEMRDLEELYHRYLGTIQALCKQKLHLGQIVDGGYDICQDREVAPRAPCLMYSFGVRDDFSFDEELSQMYGCEVHSFDPANGMQDHKHSDNIYFHSMGVGDFDGVMQDNWKIRKFSSIKKELGHTNRSLAVLKINMQGGEWSTLIDMQNTSALSDVTQLIIRFNTFAEFGHYGFPDLKDVRGHLKIARDLYEGGWRRKIEIVKIDIESGEWPAFASMAADGMFSEVRQLITELHTWVDLPPAWTVYHRKSREYRQHFTVLRQIYDAGLRIFFLRRFDAACCIFKTDLGIERTGCNEVHFMRVDD